MLFVGILLFSLPAYGQFAGGSGTAADPYQIADVDQLQAMKGAPNTSHFILVQDIDASATAGWNGGQGFDPVGWFNGSFDGQGYTISDLTINRPGTYQSALFSQTGSDAVLQNVHFDNASIQGGNRAAVLVGTLAGSINNVTVDGTINGNGTVGAVAGQIDGGGSISEVNVSADVSGSGDYIGGVVGLLNSNATAADINFEGTVSGASRVGGIAGQANSGSSITNAHVDADVTGTGVRVGGLVGYNNQGNLENNSSAGTVNGNNEVGGLVGRNESAQSVFKQNHSTADVTGDENVGGLIGFINGGTIESSYSTGVVTGITNVGGLAGFAGWGNVTIRYSFSLSHVEPAPGGGNRNQFGGLVGRLQSGTLDNTFARGDVYGNNRVGGLVGEMNSSAQIINSFSTGEVNPEAGQAGGLVGRSQQSSSSNSFWDVETSQQNSSAEGTGQNTVAMTTKETFTNAGWDFDNIWSIDPMINDGYPFLIGVGFIDDENIFYSRQHGVWGDAQTWSLQSHSGPAAPMGPGPSDVAIIGASHIVSLTEDIQQEAASITVNDTGTLNTNGFIISGGGSFILNPGGTLRIGSADGIRATANGGSIRTANRSFSTEANYVYDGITAQQTGDGLPNTVNNLRIDNPVGVSRFGSLTVNGQLQLDNGTFTMSPGASLVTYDVDQTNGNIRMQLTIEGDKGWRMLTSPVQTSYGDLLDGLVSQGFSGSDYPTLQPNTLWFDETQIGTTNMAWRTPQAANEGIQGGRGHFHFVFNGAGKTGGGHYHDELPVTIDATGLGFASGGSPFPFNITHTEREQADRPDTDVQELNTGWNLVGNPSTASLDWDNPAGWNRTHIDNTIYIWDPTANNGNGDFLVWNGENGTLANPLIAPFQAFWIRATDENATLQMTDAAKTTGGMFTGTGFSTKAEEMVSSDAIQLTLRADDMESVALITFNERGNIGEDPYDAYQLEPMSDSWLKLYTGTREHHLPMVINNLPTTLDDKIIIPLYAEGQKNGQPLSGAVDLEWQLPENLPANWTVSLMDHANQEVIDMSNGQATRRFYWNQAKHAAAYVSVDQHFSLPGNIIGGTIVSQEKNNPFDDPAQALGNSQDGFNVKSASISGSPRFSLMICPGMGECNTYMAPEPMLLPVYPNPVRDHARIRFSLPERQHVRLQVYDMQGRLIQDLKREQLEAGAHEVSWTPASNLRNGTYIAILYTLKGRSHQKLILAR